MQNKSSNRSLLWAIILGSAWTKAATLLCLPFLTLFLLKNTNLSITTIGIIVGLQPFTSCFGGMLGGYLSDIFKRQTIILFSSVASCFVYLGFYLAGTYLTSNIQIAAFALLNLLNGLSSAFFAPVIRAILSDLASSKQENVKLLHLRYLAVNFGAAIGPLIGAYVGLAANSLAFLVTAGLYFAFTISLFITLLNYTPAPKTQTTHEKVNFINNLRSLFSNRLFVLLLLSLAIFDIIYVQLTSNLAIITAENIVNGTIFFSWMLSLNAVLVIGLQPLLYLFIKNQSQQIILIYGYFIMLLGAILMLFLSVSMLSIILFVVFISIAEILIFPTSSILVAEFTAEQNRGTAYGVIELAFLGSAIGPMIGASMLQRFSNTGFFVLMLVLSALCVLVFIPCIERKPQLRKQNH